MDQVFERGALTEYCNQSQILKSLSGLKNINANGTNDSNEEKALRVSK